MLHRLLHPDESYSVARGWTLRSRHVIYMPAAVVQHPGNHAMLIVTGKTDPRIRRMVKRPVGIPILLFFRRRSNCSSLASPAHDRVKSLPTIPRNSCPPSPEISARDQLKSVPAIMRNAHKLAPA
jgi:hypothetical protein